MTEGQVPLVPTVLSVELVPRVRQVSTEELVRLAGQVLMVEQVQQGWLAVMAERVRRDRRVQSVDPVMTAGLELQESQEQTDAPVLRAVSALQV